MLNYAIAASLGTLLGLGVALTQTGLRTGWTTLAVGTFLGIAFIRHLIINRRRK